MKVYYAGRLLDNDSNDFSEMELIYSSARYIHSKQLNRKVLKLDVEDFNYLRTHLDP